MQVILNQIIFIVVHMQNNNDFKTVKLSLTDTKTTTDFINQYNGKYLSYLSPTSRECFDVSAKWANLLGVPNAPGNPSCFPYQYAYQIYANFGAFQSQYFTLVPNSLFNAPLAGDIVVFKPGYNGGAGHTAVATGQGNIFSFQCFEQNDPLGQPCQLRTYGYGLYQSGGIYGWLHPKALDKLTAQQFKDAVNSKIETQITDTAFRNLVRELLKNTS
jgi:hypothetical protein